MKLVKLFCVVITICMLMTVALVGCGNNTADKEPVEPSVNVPEVKPDPINPDDLDLLPGPDGYATIDMKDAEAYIASKENYIILDVRRIDEFAEGHIPNAINIPNEEIGTDEITELPDKNALIFVYCRSGNRSKDAAKKLATLGYSRVVEIGGILVWTGDIVVETEETPELVFHFRMPQPDVLTYKFKFPPLGRKH